MGSVNKRVGVTTEVEWRQRSARRLCAVSIDVEMMAVLNICHGDCRRRPRHPGDGWMPGRRPGRRPSIQPSPGLCRKRRRRLQCANKKVHSPWSILDHRAESYRWNPAARLFLNYPRRLRTAIRKHWIHDGSTATQYPLNTRRYPSGGIASLIVGQHQTSFGLYYVFACYDLFGTACMPFVKTIFSSHVVTTPYCVICKFSTNEVYIILFCNPW